MSYSNNYETSYTSYGGGGGGGGGFIPGDGSQNSPSGGPKDYTRDTVRPVTIKQINDAQSVGEEFKIDGAQVAQLTFVGQIRNVSSQTTNLTYKLDDGTGSMEAKHWNDKDTADEPSPGREKLVEGAYCRVWGKLKSFNDRKHVVATIIRPVEDKNEISYHLLEATYVHLHFTRGPIGEGSGGGGGSNGAAQQQDSGGHGGAALAGHNSVAKRVYEYLRTTPQTNEGLHQQDIASNLKIDAAEVSAAGDQLLADGLIYTTVDDSTWAILETD
ncbi:replication protein A, subunit RPA32 [Aaosphaeria arxii CBS 175.79]|uniref:Replication protein A, subunit RPA32 n=1 Tax=Aaosphaeria arxii CBS 175.79 TaxID=1450172 RepID=A0A6A5Y2D3_9PLEO|nr:replication protein A, subunit RPA32 [Aaosphaeria arxii CBS 175.79]KAF2018990.1 replication protein A, subunit RPA32 [Aaosphaeria arxii CBS 175.79]